MIRTPVFTEASSQPSVSSTPTPTIQFTIRCSCASVTLESVPTETYLGLTDADFQANPNRRYAASQLDRMTWWRTQAQLRYDLSMGDHVRITTVAYRHDFDRTWRRLNRFQDGPDLLQTLANPTGRRDVFYRILTGENDSTSISEDLRVVDNARRFISQGIQSTARIDFETGEVRHDIEAGVRFHHDQIDRDHVEQGYRMQSQQLVLNGRDPVSIADNEGRAIALAAYAAYGLRFFDLTVTPGLRLEVIRSNFVDDLNGTSIRQHRDHFPSGPRSALRDHRSVRCSRGGSSRLQPRLARSAGGGRARAEHELRSGRALF